jgi:hypothetical protein
MVKKERWGAFLPLNWIRPDSTKLINPSQIKKKASQLADSICIEPNRMTGQAENPSLLPWDSWVK